MTERKIYEVVIKGIPTSIKNVGQLNDTIKKVNTEFKNADFGSDKFKRLQKNLGQLKGIQQEVRKSTKEQIDEFKKLGIAENSVKGLAIQSRRLKTALEVLDPNSEDFVKYRGELVRVTREQEKLRKKSRELKRDIELGEVDKSSLRALELSYAKLRAEIKLLSLEERKSKFGKNLIRNAARTRAEILKLDARLNDFRSNVGNYKSGINSLGGSFKNLFLAFGAGFGLQEIGQAVASGIKTFASFDQQLAVLQSVSRSTKKELAPLKEEILRLGETTQFTAQQTAEAATKLARAGLSNDTILQTLEPVLQGAIATGGTLEDVADVTAKALASLKIPASEAGDFVAQLTGTLNSSNNDLNTYKESFKEFAPVASALKIPLEEVNAVIGLVADNGLQGTIGTTTLKTSLTRLADESKKYSKAAKRLGIEIFDQNGQFVGMAQLLENLEKSFAGFTDEQKLAATTQIFGAQATNQFTALLNAQKEVVVDGEKVTLRGSAALRGYTEAIKEGTEAAKISSDIVGDTLSQDFLKFQSAVEGATIRLIESKDEGIRAFVQELTKLVPQLISSLGPIVNFAASLGTLTISFLDLLKTLGLVKGELDSSEQGFNVFTATVNALVLPLKLVSDSLNTKVNLLNKVISTVTGASDAVKDINSEFIKEKKNIEDLFEPLKNDTATREEKKKAIDDLKKAYPDYLKGINLEKSSITELDKVQNQLLDSLKKTIIERRKQAEIAPILEKQIDAEIRLQELQEKGYEGLTRLEKLNEDRFGFAGQRRNDESTQDFALRSAKESLEKEIEERKKERGLIEDSFNKTFGSPERKRTRADYLSDLAKQKEVIDNITDGTDKNTTATEKGTKAVNDAKKATEEALNELEKLTDLYDSDEVDNSLFERLKKEAEGLDKFLENIDKRQKEISNTPPPRVDIAPQAAQEENEINQDFLDRKLQKEKDYLNLSKLEQLEADKEILEEKFNNADTEFTERLGLAKQLASAELNIEREKESELAAIRKERYDSITEGFEGVQQGLNIIAEFSDAATSRQLNKVNEKYEREIELAAGNEEEITRLEQKRDDEKRKIEKAAFERNKKFAIAQSLINGALAVTAILSVPDFTLGIASAIRIAAAIATTAAQVATISGTTFTGRRGLRITQEQAILLGHRHSDSEKMAQGGTVKLNGFAQGKTHEQGGIHTRLHGVPVEIEKDEFLTLDEFGGLNVIAAKASRANANVLKLIGPQQFPGKLQMLSNINQSGGGKALARDGINVPRPSPNFAAIGRDSFRRRGIDVKVKVDNSEMIKATESLALVASSLNTLDEKIANKVADAIETVQFELYKDSKK